MAIKSMTGYGKSKGKAGGRTVVCEIKSLNSRFLDLIVKTPAEYREKELDIRNIVSEQLQRGKVDVTIRIEPDGESDSTLFNENLVKKYYKELSALADELHAPKQDLLKLAMSQPDALERPVEPVTEDVFSQLKKIIRDACVKANAYRLEEGNQLHGDLKNSTASIVTNLEKIALLAPERIKTVEKRLQEQLSRVKDANIDQNRYEQELIYYLEKIDINEEKVRLETHCNYFLETAEKDGSGKMLGFIAQEMGREINTIGSKANHPEIQKLVVLMKDDLEKIKEQAMNIL